MTKLKKIALLIMFTILIICFLLIYVFDIAKLLHPKKYEQYVSKYAREYDVDELLIYAIIKIESNFNENASSHVNAIGLMQLMENTAIDINNKINEQQITEQEIYDPETNIKLGTCYFSMLLKKYGNIGLALAAYNAGMGRVDEWIKNGTIQQDGSDLENIPFKETDLYVRKVINNYEKYKKIYDKST